ncbi:acyl-[acyl-carrier-protein]--UDP-N-acetylglucosamine O-acyltransferase [Hydrogenivirga caldilitoris]|uniref:Acyl-[acyl-carrier-protein]--UDP-N-acetylglucosamine O-acyltransferase n=1 Tax=Hydrogenivirga caldilitoris TaxID=246264 RepID=A0A497XQ94_9AQUI|nr:acyl-ACP--UDP-N-acetylglucosamine O-acyltransferase [Hydrogenivirga caldilitoris]RLJ71135.1 acyl-[acyl-carrier-protein]--UDP-N-acetylglucosamine O-acyltransferase [Hydrogenivirga caldilitoris]
MKVHPTAIIGDEVKLGKDVEVGAFCVIEGKVEIGDRTKIGNRVTIKGKTKIGENCRIYDGAVIGEEPQHLRYEGEESEVIVGNNVLIREYVTIHRGTKIDKMKTIIGDDVMLMAYSHVAHDCVVGRGVIMANCATLGGHVEVGEYSFIGGLSAVHQWARIGPYSMVGGLTGVSLDIPPFTRASGQHAQLYGVNTLGLQRRGFSSERIAVIKRAYRILFRSNLLRKEAIDILKKEFKDNEDVELLINFIESSKRGVARDAGA